MIRGMRITKFKLIFIHYFIRINTIYQMVIVFSKTIENNYYIDIGLLFDMSCLSPFLKIRITLATFNSSVKVPLSKEELMRC